MEISDNIIIKFNSDFPALFQNFAKNISYINNMIAEQTGSGLFIEPVADGLLYIYKDLEHLKLLNKPYHPFTIKTNCTISTEPNKKKQENFFLDHILDEKSYPLNGISLFFENVSNDNKDILDVFYDFINAIPKHNIILFRLNNIKIQVHFKTFSALKVYADAVESLFLTKL